MFRILGREVPSLGITELVVSLLRWLSLQSNLQTPVSLAHLPFVNWKFLCWFQCASTVITILLLHSTHFYSKIFTCYVSNISSFLSFLSNQRNCIWYPFWIPWKNYPFFITARLLFEWTIWSLFHVSMSCEWVSISESSSCSSILTRIAYSSFLNSHHVHGVYISDLTPLRANWTRCPGVGPESLVTPKHGLLSASSSSNRTRRTSSTCRRW